jgi:hypothetical protein
MAEVSAAAAAAGNPRAEWGKNCPKGSPAPPFKYPVATRPNNLAKRDPDYPAWEARNWSTRNFKKQKLFFVKK